MRITDPKERKTRRVALQCASRSENKDVRRVLRDAELYIAWLEKDTTEVAVQIKERFPNG